MEAREAYVAAGSLGAPGAPATRRWKAIEGTTVAKALRALAAEDARGTRVVESAELQRYAGR